MLLYHAGLAWIPGGFLGVEVFFVISGYLITALLLAEWRQRGRVDLRAFWLRRARRLLPALYLLLVVTLAYAVVFLPGEVAGLRADALAAFGYVTNWYLVLGQESYFEAVGRPSLLQHLWSLAVEEQFYLLWPLVFAVGMGFGATRLRRRRVVNVALAGAAASAGAMALLYVPGVDPSRVYYAPTRGPRDCSSGPRSRSSGRLARGTGRPTPATTAWATPDTDASGAGGGGPSPRCSTSSASPRSAGSSGSTSGWASSSRSSTGAGPRWSGSPRWR